MKLSQEKLLKIVVLILVIYLFAAQITYRFKHPELTDTQRILHLGDALLWK